MIGSVVFDRSRTITVTCLTRTADRRARCRGRCRHVSVNPVGVMVRSRDGLDRQALDREWGDAMRRRRDLAGRGRDLRVGCVGGVVRIGSARRDARDRGRAHADVRVGNRAVHLELLVGKRPGRPLGARVLERQRTRRHDCEQRGDRDREDHQRDDHLDEALPGFAPGDRDSVERRRLGGRASPSLVRADLLPTARLQRPGRGKRDVAGCIVRWRSWVEETAAARDVSPVGDDRAGDEAAARAVELPDHEGQSHRVVRSLPDSKLVAAPFALPATISSTPPVGAVVFHVPAQLLPLTVRPGPQMLPEVLTVPLT